MKDYFSGHSSVYAAFRPAYPDSLYEFVFARLNGFAVAWDCATGNGQVAQALASRFASVEATDISQQQLDNAIQKENIRYSISPAEKTTFPDGTFDLVTVGQALHWFDHEKFFSEIKRVTKPNGMLAVWGYSVLSISPEIDPIFYDYYNHTVGEYWDEARRHVEEEYARIAFPFAGIESEKFSFVLPWTLPQFAGYLRSWSATQKFIKARGFDPTSTVVEKLREHWGEAETKRVSFPIFLKLMRVAVK